MNKTLLSFMIALISVVSQAQWSASAGVNTRITNANQAQGDVRLLPDGSGGAFIAYLDGRNLANDDIYIQKINADGVMQWTANGVPVCTAAGSPSEYTIISDNSDGVYVIWRDDRIGFSITTFHAQHIGSDGTILWANNGIPLNDTLNTENVKAVPDGNGGLLISWYDDTPPSPKVYAQRINSNGDQQWANPVIVCNDAMPEMVSDQSGGAIFSWVDNRNGSANLQVFAQRIDGNGQLQWAIDGIAISATSTEFLKLSLSETSSGGCIASWCNRIAPSGIAISVQGLNNTGALKWAANGVSIGPEVGSDLKVVATADGGAVVAWQNYNPSDSQGRIYSQKVNLQGDVQWPTGAMVKPSALNQSYFDVIADDSGGAYVALVEWHLSNASKIFMQHFASDGSHWPTPALVCNGGFWQTAPKITDTPQGIIAAWSDIRNGLVDVYAQKICSSGELGTCTLDLPEFSQEKDIVIFPNPSNGSFTIQGSKVFDQIIINDVLGKQILSIMPAASEVSITLPEIVSGIYYVKMVYGSQQRIKKLVVE